MKKSDMYDPTYGGGTGSSPDDPGTQTDASQSDSPDATVAAGMVSRSKRYRDPKASSRGYAPQSLDEGTGDYGGQAWLAGQD